jgi:hypothetical protein
MEYLWFTLDLQHDPEQFRTLWSILAEEWHWEPLSSEEWQYLYNRLEFPQFAVSDKNEIIASTATATLQHNSAFLGPLPPGSRMPVYRNPLFVGRRKELHALASALLSDHPSKHGYSGATVVAGIEGIGKTALAAEFVHQYGQYFPGGVFWLNFADTELIATEIAACGDHGHMALQKSFDALSREQQAELVIRAWEQPTLRLLVCDSCEDPALLRQWLPQQGGCRVLLTSRCTRWDITLGVRMLLLSALSRVQSIALLHKYRPDLSITDANLAAIAAELEDLPLALHDAGQALGRAGTTVTPAVYLEHLRSRRRNSYTQPIA